MWAPNMTSVQILKSILSMWCSVSLTLHHYFAVRCIVSLIPVCQSYCLVCCFMAGCRRTCCAYRVPHALYFSRTISVVFTFHYLLSPDLHTWKLYSGAPLRDIHEIHRPRHTLFETWKHSALLVGIREKTRATAHRYWVHRLNRQLF